MPRGWMWADTWSRSALCARNVGTEHLQCYCITSTIAATPKRSISWKGETRLLRQTAKSEMRQAFYETVALIPPGTVATYGQIASLAGYPGRARHVGYALAGMPDDLDLPWHRVINAQGKVSPRSSGRFHELQYRMLEDEGIPFQRNRVDLGAYRWCPSEFQRRS